MWTQHRSQLLWFFFSSWRHCIVTVTCFKEHKLPLHSLFLGNLFHMHVFYAALSQELSCQNADLMHILDQDKLQGHARTLVCFCLEIGGVRERMRQRSICRLKFPLGHSHTEDSFMIRTHCCVETCPMQVGSNISLTTVGAQLRFACMYYFCYS